ncbi:MAG: TetR/AcrR family transcriptional regulator [Hyphomicrobiales bacterium]|uniref:TetR/AcrR family transcriptional regulator n=1 Tax=Rhabdaerophilum calidifontis TaxID=2604328 RepID=UPI001FE4BA52|nr:TetR family transcriptional regulator [Rhabdaerophilum calidifontis]MCA1953357.1 TetR/AcrR family transcriptional regulator [Hyphomicrobiales bacterium]MCA2000116.1 TetR/AcrR family transcriptional regulator [Hyphomicrobiales bacterium]
MNVRQRISAEDMRERIITVAEEHFRRLGYSKTAVADIAAALGMSPANIYRFFPSKNAINNAICAKLAEETRALVAEIVARPLPAAERLRIFFLALHQHNRATLIHEHRLHDMVEAAMEENWPAIEAHCAQMEAFLAQLIRDGIAAGEFRAVDPEAFAATAFDAGLKIFHPTMIAHCSRCSTFAEMDSSALALADLIIAALRP